MREYYYRNWKKAEKAGLINLANIFKHKYELLVKEGLKELHKQYIESLKAYPPIYLS